MADPRPAIELGRELGSGATGRVVLGTLTEAYGAFQAGHRVAVKLLHEHLAETPAAVEAFETEATALHAVRHPGLVELLFAGELHGQRALVLEYVPGPSLKERLETEGGLPEPQVRAIGEQLAEALEALRNAGWTHGDVKPANVRLDENGDARLLDLGFARPLRGETPSGARRARKRDAGSLAYLSPEQAEGGERSAKSDVYALGLLLYELATGEHPYLHGASIGADRLLEAIRCSRPLAPSTRHPQLSPFLDQLLLDVLTQNPRHRPSAGELARRLKEREGGEWWRARVELSSGAGRVAGAEPAARHFTQLAGRETAMATLFHLYEEAQQGGAVWISGAAGVGKSRLVTEFAAAARMCEEPPMFLYGRAPRLEEGRPYQPVLRLLSRFLRLPPTAAAGDRERALLADLVAPDVVEALLATLHPHEEDGAQLSVEAALASWLAALSRRVRLIVFVDDVQWAGVGTLGLLARFAEGLEGSGLFLMLGERTHVPVRAQPELDCLRARIAELPRYAALPLEPLDEKAIRALVDEAFHRTAPRLRLASVLWSRTRGNPGHFTEILRGLVARGDATQHPQGGGLTLAIEPDALPLPSSLARTIVEAYRDLPVPDQLWLRRLAVFGGRLRTGVLLRAFGAKKAELDTTLDRLVRAGWLVGAADGYRFARPAQREAVYRGLSPEVRRRLHKTAADALRPAPGAQITVEDAFRRVFHLRAAREHEALLRLVRPLLERLRGRGAPPRLLTLCTWALKALDEVPRTRERDQLRVELLQVSADAANRSGDHRAEGELLDRLTELPLDPEVEPGAVARVYLLHAHHAASVGRYGLARGFLRNARKLARRAGDRQTQSRATRRAAVLEGHVGDLGRARPLAIRALESAEELVDVGLAHAAVAYIDLLSGELEEALRETDRALKPLRRARGADAHGARAAVHILRTRIYRTAGRPARAFASAQRAVRLARLAGERSMEAEATARLGGVLLDLDRREEAEARLREALRLAIEIGDQRGRTLAGVFLGTLLAEAGDPEAPGILERTSQLAAATGLYRAQALSLGVRARIRYQSEHPEEALELALRAEELVERHGSETADRVAIVGTVALLLRALGRPEEARRRVRRLHKSVERENRRITSPVLRQRHHRATSQLLEAVLSAEGPLFPRVRLKFEIGDEA